MYKICQYIRTNFKIYLRNTDSFVTGTFRNVASLLFHVILVDGRIKLPELPSLHSRGSGVDRHSFQSKFYKELLQLGGTQLF